MKSKSTEQSVGILSIHLIYNINKVNLICRHKHEIFSEKVTLFHVFSLIIKKVPQTWYVQVLWSVSLVAKSVFISDRKQGSRPF